MKKESNIDNIFQSRDWLSVEIDTKKIDQIFLKAKEEKKWVIQIVVGTKPDFYKQYPLMYWAEKLDIPLILVTTGQHHDYPLDYGLTEFNMAPTIDLQVRGNLIEKVTELFYKMGSLAKWFKKIAPKTIVMPIPHGDTLSAAITATAWFLSIRQGVAQNEAGLRAMAPQCIYNLKTLIKPDFYEGFIYKQWDDKWFIIRDEPYPEQWDTFVCGAGASYFFAPHQINIEHLKREGYHEDRMNLVGNSVVDAIKLHKKPETSIFTLYPKLEKNDNWIRVDIHRRENLGRQRFLSIVKAILKLLKEGFSVIWIEMNATEKALLYYNLRKDVLDWTSQYENFIFTPVWPQYGHVIEFWRSKKCLMELTDSGSIQEELNEITEVLCCTARFSTDRPESIFDAHSNVLIPPFSEELMSNLVKCVIDSEDIQNTMKKSKKIYGIDVGKQIIEYLRTVMSSNDTPFRWAHQTLFNLPDEDNPEYL